MNKPDKRRLAALWRRVMNSEVKTLLIFVVVMGAWGVAMWLDDNAANTNAASNGVHQAQQAPPFGRGGGGLPPREKAEAGRAHHHRILFIGDSMLEGLMRRFGDYAAENGHELDVVLWYSSSTELWAKGDVLERSLRKYRPTFVVVCLGSNELFVRDLPKREQYVATIVQRVDSLPFVWIGPPNWRKDTGINDVIVRHVGPHRYFDSRRLTLERSSDHMHPTMRAAAQWMDSVAAWMNSPRTAQPIPMNLPQKKGKPAHVELLQPEG